MRSNILAFFIFSLLLSVSLPAISLAQMAPGGDHKKKEESAAAAKGYITKIFETKYRDPIVLANVLQGLSSHENGSQFQPNRELKTIVVRDYPEVVATIEEALNRLDVPEAIPVNLEVQLHLVAASRGKTQQTDFPTALAPVIAQLQTTLKYSGYHYITTFINRCNDGGHVNAEGATAPLFPISVGGVTAHYKYSIKDAKLITDTGGKESIQIRDFSFVTENPFLSERDGGSKVEYRQAIIQSELSLREGEMVVVGTANLGSLDEAIILVLTVRKIR